MNYPDNKINCLLDMKTPDVVFYISMVGLFSKTAVELVANLKPITIVDWIVLGLTVVSTVCYAAYDYLTGTKATPQ